MFPHIWKRRNLKQQCVGYSGRNIITKFTHAQCLCLDMFIDMFNDLFSDIFKDLFNDIFSGLFSDMFRDLFSDMWNDLLNDTYTFCDMLSDKSNTDLRCYGLWLRNEVYLLFRSSGNTIEKPLHNFAKDVVILKPLLTRKRLGMPKTKRF